MELFQLRYFMAVVREGSISAAARSCFVSQPSLSSQIALLEEEMGSKLLSRTPRGTTPTPAGRRLFLSANRVEKEMKEAHDDIRNRHFELDLPIRLGVQPMIAASLLPEALRHLLHDRLQSKITIKERPSEVLPELVFHREVDACLMTEGPSISSELTVIPLVTMKYVAFVPREHPLGKRSRLKFRQLLPHRLVLFNDALDLQARVQKAAVTHSKNAQIAFSSDQALTVLHMAASGLGIAILPAFLQKISMGQKLKAIPLEEPGLKSRIVAVWRKDQAPSLLLQKLFDTLKD